MAFKPSQKYTEQFFLHFLVISEHNLVLQSLHWLYTEEILKICQFSWCIVLSRRFFVLKQTIGCLANEVYSTIGIFR